MKETEFDIAALPDDQLPAACELPGELSEVAEVIGVKPTLALAERFRGTKVYFHNIDKILREHRNKRIKQLYDQESLTIPQLARIFRISERWVSEILSRPEQEDRQWRLFD